MGCLLNSHNLEVGASIEGNKKYKDKNGHESETRAIYDL